MQNIAYYTAVSRFLETAKIQLFRKLMFTHSLNFKERLISARVTVPH